MANRDEFRIGTADHPGTRIGSIEEPEVVRFVPVDDSEQRGRALELQTEVARRAVGTAERIAALRGQIAALRPLAEAGDASAAHALLFAEAYLTGLEQHLAGLAPAEVR